MGHPDRNSLAYGAALGNIKHDVHDMARSDKKQDSVQKLNIISTLGFISIYMAT